MVADKMNELVRRADVQDEIDRWLDSVGTILIGKGLSSYGELIGCLEDAPAADVEPVRHGRWIMHADELGLTSECSACYIETMCDGNYCPYCEAKMDKEAET